MAWAVAARVFDTQRAVSLPVDSERQRIVTVDASPRAVKKALRRYDPRTARRCGAVVAKAHRRHERNMDGLGAQVLRADQLAPLLLAHALTGLQIACRPREWDFGDAYGEEGAMALFGCGRGADGRMQGVGVFAASAALDRLLGADDDGAPDKAPERSWVHRIQAFLRPQADKSKEPERKTVVNPRIDAARRDAFLAAVPLLKPARGPAFNVSFNCAAPVYCVKVSAHASNASLAAAAAVHNFQLARTVLRPQLELVRAARPRPLDIWGNATVRVALHVRRGDVMPVDSADRGASEGAAWGLPLKPQCKAVELAAYWPCVAAYLESRANETARVVVVSTAGQTDLPGADGAPVADVAYLADRPPPPRATARSNAHVDALARDLDVMASATALFFSPASSMAMLGAALAPDDAHLFEVRSRARFCSGGDACRRLKSHKRGGGVYTFNHIINHHVPAETPAEHPGQRHLPPPPRRTVVSKLIGACVCHLDWVGGWLSPRRADTRTLESYNNN
jgi:hypothetical protein